MRVDIALGAGLGVGPAQVHHAVDQAHEGLAVDQLLQPVEIEREGFQQGGQIGGVPLSGHVALGKADGAGRHHSPHEAVVLDRQMGGGAGPGPVTHQGVAIGQDQLQIAVAPVLKQEPRRRAEHRGGAAPV